MLFDSTTLCRRLAVTVVVFMAVGWNQSVTAQQSMKIVSVFNTFEDPTQTGGAEVGINQGGPLNITGEVEFPGYLGIFDIEVGLKKIKMTLVDNSSVDNILPSGRFYRYYFSFHKTVAAAEVIANKKSDIIGSTTILEPGYTVEFEDLFGTGLVSPIVLQKGGILVEILPGTNFTEIGQKIAIGFMLGKFDSVSPCDGDSLSFVLWDADAGTVIGPLGNQINLCELGSTSLTIEAVYPCADKVKLKLFDGSGNVIEKKIQKVRPFVLGGDVVDTNEIFPVDALRVPGSYTLKVLPKPGFTKQKVRFEVLDECR